MKGEKGREKWKQIALIFDKMTFEQQTKEMEAEINWLNKLTELKERKTEMKNKEIKNEN